MATSKQPLLGSPKSSIIRSKTLFIVITTLAVVVLVAFLAPNMISNSQSDAPLPLSSSFRFPATLSRRCTDVSPSRLCRRATDRDACETVLNRMVSRTDGTKISTPGLLQKFLTKYIRFVSFAMSKFNMVGGEFSHPREIRALADCLELMELSVEEVRDTITALASRSSQSRADAQTSLSAVLTNHVTCMDGLRPSEKSTIRGVLEDLISRARIALAVLAEITGQNEEEIKTSFRIPLKVAFPAWVKSRDRKLLQSKGKDIKADFVVSQDGKGNFSTLTKAVEAVKIMSNTRVVIYVKKGIYNEYVEVASSKKNLMIVGDGMNETIFTGDHNYVDNYTTYNSFTLASKGAKFILQDLCVLNTAGPGKHQAVALRVGGDKSIINRCLIQGYQDTLYAHSLRQFYRDCNVSGTVDFIFGNAAAVFQNCNIIARKPMDTQQNMVTAQGRADPNQNTGISLQFCNIIPSEYLKPVTDHFETFLGRPWKNFSRTMVMESFIDHHIDPAGWHEWVGDMYLDTLWFGEFSNNGPGSVTSKRVHWPGYHVVYQPSVAADFTVAKLLQSEDDRWVAASGIDCVEGLLLILEINQTNNVS